MTSEPRQPLSDLDVAVVRLAAEIVLKADEALQEAEDFDGLLALLQQLHKCGLAEPRLARFAGLLESACDPDTRCPK